MSEPIDLRVGSPQGSILSPTLFIILLADIELWCRGAKLCGYADNTTCTVYDTNINNWQNKCEEKVNQLLTYMTINRLAANYDKTKFLVMEHGNQDDEFTFKIGDAEVKESTSEKLGVWVANSLNWAEQIEKLEDELSYRLYTLRKLEQVIPKFLLKKVADGIFNSIIRYALGNYCQIRTHRDDPIPSSINGIRVRFNDVLRLLCNTKSQKAHQWKACLRKQVGSR